ncbi:Uncharacterised protein [Mycobacterium tuberculosis]|nr:Uncharacterised protein [Mycobacterium tuberculosis]
MRGGHRSGLCVTQARWQRRGQPSVTRDECAPAAVRRHATNMVTNLVVSDAWSDRGHHAGEIRAQLGQVSLEAGVATESDEYIGKVDAGRTDRNLDLSWSWWNAVKRGQLYRLHIAGGTDLQAHAALLMIRDDGAPLLRTQRGRTQARHVPRRRSSAVDHAARPAQD